MYNIRPVGLNSQKVGGVEGGKSESQKRQICSPVHPFEGGRAPTENVSLSSGNTTTAPFASNRRDSFI